MSDSKFSSSRHTGFELLRIVSAAMIVVMHAIGHGGLGASATSNTAEYYIYWLVYSLCRVSTNCFVMLTGYYMVKSKIRASRIFRIWFEVLFYSLLTYLAAVLCGCCDLSVSEMLRAITPIYSGEYWFATCYIFLYMSVPLLNYIIMGIKSERKFAKIILIMLIVTSLLPTVLYWADPLFVNGGYSFIWFVVLYFIAAYIRLCGIRVSKKLLAVFYVSLALISPLIRILAELVQVKIGATTLVDNLLDYKMPTILIMSVSFFLLFRDVEIKNGFARRAVLKIAPLSFGIYLLHDSDYLRKLLWDIVDISRFDGILPSLAYVAAVTILIFAAGCAVGTIYRWFYKLLPFNRAETALDNLTKTKR